MVNFLDVIDKTYSREDKEEFIALIKVMVDLSNKAYEEGLLSLENDYLSLHPFLLRKGIELVVEGCNVRELRNILDNYILSQKCSEPELLAKLIVREGVILLQNGDRGKLLYEKILSMLGEDFFEGLDDSILKEEASNEWHSSDINILDEESKVFVDQIMSIADFEDRIFTILDFEEMEQLVRRAGYVKIAIALHGASTKVKRYVKNMMSSKHMRDGLIQEMRTIGQYRLEDCIEAQQFIKRLI